MILFEQPIEEFDPDERYVSLYQGLKAVETEGNQTKVDRVRWTKPSEESDDSIYDLFTPPIIYLVDGNLTTKLPEKVVETMAPVLSASSTTRGVALAAPRPRWRRGCFALRTASTTEATADCSATSTAGKVGVV